MTEFTLDDFRLALTQIAKLGPINEVIESVPGFKAFKEMVSDVDAERDLHRILGMIDAMTDEERSNPSRMIDASRGQRIAAGSGVDPSEVTMLVKHFCSVADVMNRMRKRFDARFGQPSRRIWWQQTDWPPTSL